MAGRSKGPSIKICVTSFATTLLQPGLTVEPSQIVSFVDPRTQGEGLRKQSLKPKVKKQARTDTAQKGPSNDPFDIDGDDDGVLTRTTTLLNATRPQLELFNEVRSLNAFPPSSCRSLLSRIRFFHKTVMRNYTRSAPQ